MVKASVMLLLGFCLVMQANAQNKKPVLLGSGLTVFMRGIIEITSKDPLRFYSDTTLTHFTSVTLEQTTCPTCMRCAEPTDYYEGPIHPFLCGYSGMCFLTTEQGKDWREVIIDTNGKRAYLKKKDGKYYSWRDWMILQGKANEYLMRNGYNADLLLYNKPYDLQHLPTPDANKLVGIKLKNIEEMHLIPVDVKGYWMKVHIVDYWKKSHGYCWFIWRTESNWTFGFKWHAD